jgi:hypothetical protein
MSLYLFEIQPEITSRGAVERLIAGLDEAASAAAGEVVESQVTGDLGRIFTIVEATSPGRLAAAITTEGLAGASSVTGPDEVRLVGAELSDVKAARPAAGYLVEWDLPEGLDMESYLARKKANSPMYAKVPEVSFLRTYVREDMVKCLCLYNGPGEESVLRAREAVETPVDRLHTLDRGAEGR